MSESVPLPRAPSGAARPLAHRPRPPIESPVRLPASGAHVPTASQIAWLQRGLDQPGGKLPLFDANGKKVDTRTIRRCLDVGWAEPWFTNPIKPDWLVCKLTASGRALALRALRARSGGRQEPRAETPGPAPTAPLPLR
jgi:hypothetical protein